MTAKKIDLRVGFNRRLKLKFLGSQVITDARLLAYHELDETLALTAIREGFNLQPIVWLVVVLQLVIKPAYR